MAERVNRAPAGACGEESTAGRSQGGGRCGVREMVRAVVDAFDGHGPSHLAFDEGVDQQRDLQAEGERVDAGIALQGERSGLDDALEPRVAALEVRLGLVDAKQLGWSEGCVRDEGKATVAGSVVGDGFCADGHGEREAMVLDPPVAGALPRAAPGLLAVLDLDHVCHLDLHPGRGADLGHDPCRRLFDGDPRPQLAAG